MATPSHALVVEPLLLDPLEHAAMRIAPAKKEEDKLFMDDDPTVRGRRPGRHPNG
jgi:hypothetical protein